MGVEQRRVDVQQAQPGGEGEDEDETDMSPEDASDAGHRARRAGTAGQRDGLCWNVEGGTANH